MAEPTKEQIALLASAMADILDDMGKDGCSVCGLAKAKARAAWEPFKVDETGEAYEPDFTMKDAQAVFAACDIAYP